MMDYQGYKGRVIDFDKKVMIYKNLHNGKFSVKQGNLVVAHVDSVMMECGMFKVNEAGRKRVLIEKKKNVHAFIVGYIDAVNVDVDVAKMRAISYNPYKFGHFYFKDDGSMVSPMGYDDIYCSAKDGLFIN